jgi:hypothetical protein
MQEEPRVLFDITIIVRCRGIQVLHTGDYYTCITCTGIQHNDISWRLRAKSGTKAMLLAGALACPGLSSFGLWTLSNRGFLGTITRAGTEPPVQPWRKDTALLLGQSAPPPSAIARQPRLALGPVLSLSWALPLVLGSWASLRPAVSSGFSGHAWAVYPSCSISSFSPFPFPFFSAVRSPPPSLYLSFHLPCPAVLLSPSYAVPLTDRD